MEECPVLVILKCVVNLLIPYDSPIRWGYIHQLEPEGVSHQIVGEYGCSLQAGVRPSVAIWMCDVELCDRYSLDLVGSLGDCTLDGLFIRIGKD